MPYAPKKIKLPWNPKKKKDTNHENWSKTKFYSSRAWRTIRAKFKQANPLCAHCLNNNIIKAMYVVDHIKPRQDGGTEDESNLQSLCKRCHAKKTGQENNGRRKK